MNKFSNQDTVVFYDVPLVCGAAPSIGCGSRAKPLLIDLEQQPPIKEAWLNRTGTIIGIAWRGRPRMEEVGRPVFARHEIEYRERDNDEQTTGSFRLDGSWFRGAEVDRLSLEEAREIAETSVTFARKTRLISPEEAAHIKSDIETHFRKELLKFRTKQELLQDIQTKFPEAVFDIYQKHIGPKGTAELEARGIQKVFNREAASSCCS
jgi:hypothetical protein